MTEFPLRDFSMRPVPGFPSVTLPERTKPSDYKDGVYVFGGFFWRASEVAVLPREERDRLLRAPHMLLYGRKGMMLLSAGDEMVLDLSALVGEVGKVLAA